MNENIDTVTMSKEIKHCLIVRRTEFTDCFPNGVRQQHGFLPPTAVQPAVDFAIDNDSGNYGNTPLNAAETQAMLLIDSGVPLANIVIFIITDGMNNVPRYTAADITDAIDKITSKGEIESIATVLIGINFPENSYQHQQLLDFQQAAGLTRFVPFDEANASTLGKLSRLISQSIVTTSKALGTGGPSQVVTGLQNGGTGGGFTA